MTGAIPLPHPPLDDGVVALRPWRPGDGAALADAWRDAQIARRNAVPDAPSVELAERWIAGEARRREEGRALDLVVTPTGDDATVLGEVGLVPGRAPVSVDLGWWIAATYRGNGYASRAVTLLATWVHDALGWHSCAAVDVDNVASLAVARRAGVTTSAPARQRPPARR